MNNHKSCACGPFISGSMMVLQYCIFDSSHSVFFNYASVLERCWEVKGGGGDLAGSSIEDKRTRSVHSILPAGSSFSGSYMYELLEDLENCHQTAEPTLHHSV